MNNTYLLLDLTNIFFRARHAIRGNADIQLGMAFHIVFNSIKKAWNDFNGNHVIVCLEGRSWRKDFYPPYKRNRQELRESLTAREQEEDQIFWEALDTFKEFLREKTNCTVLHHPQLEADDLIAGWIRNHVDDKHVIISTDSDFYQLISDNVSQYNGVTDTHITHTGFFDVKGRPIKDKKTGEVKAAPNPQWLLFEKCMRGDATDNIFSAYPGVRTKGTKNRVGLLEAFEDRNSQGWAWNNLQLQKWTDHEGQEHRVLDDYQRNKTLIDLNAQPIDVKGMIDDTIANNCKPKNIPQVGIHMIKFCNQYDMKKIIENIQQYAPAFQANYYATSN